MTERKCLLVGPLGWLSRAAVAVLGALALLAVASVTAPGPAQAAEEAVLYSISPRDTKLRTVNPANGKTLASKTIQFSGPGTQGGHALATHPQTSKIFAILALDQKERKRILATIDPVSGIATREDDFGTKPTALNGVSALAFDATGRLFSAFAANNHPDFANKLFEVDIETGVQTFFADLGDSEAGNALAFNPIDGMLYHLSGTIAFGTTIKAIFEKIDLTSKARTTIPVSGAKLGHVRAMTFARSGDFLVTGGPQTFVFSPDSLFTLTPGGLATKLGNLDHQPKGLAFVPPVSSKSVVSDFDGDGDSDIFWHHVEDGRNRLWFMKGLARDGQASPPPFANTDWEVAGLGDFDGDRLTDVLWHHAVNGKNRIWLMDGGTRRSSTTIEKFASIKWQVAGVADHDGDGNADILWRHGGNGRNQVWLMEGATRKAAGTIPRIANVAWRVEGTGDSDGDNSADILWRNGDDGRNKVWLMDGLDRKGQGNLPELANANWTVAGFADFDGDRKADILWRNIANGKNQIWRLDGAARKSKSAIPDFANTSWGVATLGDYDGDRLADILWRQANNGRNKIWLMDGFARKAQGEIPKFANTLFEAQ